MVNFGPLAAEIASLVWGTPANFNGLRVLAALLHSQTAALNRGSHLYSAGRPSRWALAQISSYGMYQGSALSLLLFLIVIEAICVEFRDPLPWDLLYADDWF